ncbi:hypothetical protein CTAYLR_009908 [Chrysophaeum taylorii]|uniref:Uncharacterized protein n=1 Tax=Chrysophaeum taylorii TaxID=2483200 RepID=A0AAD7UAA7_9STRA|nr:hypothetical protein CTAYLR_009908 [Chrysophaeum taylorii]
MPATAGRTKMPHNNRMSTSGALKMTGMWSKTIGYDPYAPEGENTEETAQEAAAKVERSRGILELARLSNVGLGIGDRGADFSKNIFWGLKRKRPPKGWEVPALDESSDDDDDESDDESDNDSPPIVDEEKKEREESKKKKNKKKKKKHKKEKRKHRKKHKSKHNTP